MAAAPTTRRRMSLFAGAVLVGIVTGFLFMVHRATNVPNSAVATGRIVKALRVGGGYEAEVSFESSSGHRYGIIGPVEPHRPSVGAAIPVTYNRADPTQARFGAIPSFELPMLLVVFGGAAVALLVRPRR